MIGKFIYEGVWGKDRLEDLLRKLPVVPVIEVRDKYREAFTEQDCKFTVNGSANLFEADFTVRPDLPEWIVIRGYNVVDISPVSFRDGEVFLEYDNTRLRLVASPKEAQDKFFKTQSKGIYAYAPKIFGERNQPPA